MRIFAAFLLISFSCFAFNFENPLIEAADKDDKNKVSSLLRSKFPVNSEEEFGVTAVMRASYRGHYSIVIELLRYGADVNKIDKGGATALHLASRANRYRIVNLLLSNGANINAQDNEGWTPLMRAILSRNSRLAILLVRRGADANIRNSFNESSLIHATRMSMVDVIKEMKKYNEFKEEDLLTSAKIARVKGLYDILNILKVNSNSNPPINIEQNVTKEKIAVDEVSIAENQKYFLLQLGAFRKREQAEYVWKELVKRFDSLKNLEPDVIRVLLGLNRDLVYRLRAGYFINKASANNACKDLRDSNIECYIVESSADEKKFKKYVMPKIGIDLKLSAKKEQEEVKEVTPRKILSKPIELKPVISEAVRLEELGGDDVKNKNSKYILTLLPFDTKMQAEEYASYLEIDKAQISKAEKNNNQVYRVKLFDLDYAKTSKICNMAKQDGLECNFGSSKPIIVKKKVIAKEEPKQLVSFIPRKKPAYIAEAKKIGIISSSKNSDRVKKFMQKKIKDNILDVQKITFWAHLGSFYSPREANYKWVSLKNKFNFIFKGFSRNIYSPSTSSNSVYRLRTGPFSSRSEANGFCAILRRNNTMCLVVK